MTEPADLREILRRLATQAPDRIGAYRTDGTAVTFAELQGRADAAAAALDLDAPRVPLLVSNTIESVVAIQTVWQHGRSAVLINAATPDAEVHRRIGETTTAPPNDDEAIVVFTSGTTGRPKGAAITARALTTSLRSMARGSGVPEEGHPPTDPPRTAYPVFTSLAHVGGVIGSTYAWWLGKPLLIVEKFHAEEVFDLIQRFRLTVLRLTPAMVHDLAYWPEERLLAPVRSVTVGTAALAESVRTRFEERYGIPALANYGQTEMSGAIAFERYDDVRDGRRPPGSVGRIAPGVEVRIVDESGTDVATGAVGEIWARSATAMTGYVGERSEHQRGAWIRTGDLGRLDSEGFLFVVGRLRDVIICGGFNIYPAVVEAALGRLPDVAEAVVAGGPDDRLGEVPLAAVVLRPGATNDGEGLRAELRSEIAPYEIPRRIAVVDRLPRTAAGKPDRQAVARLAAD